MTDAEAPVAAATGATKNKILFSFFWSIFSLVTTIQFDVDLFSAACGGDAGMTARSLAAARLRRGLVHHRPDPLRGGRTRADPHGDALRPSQRAQWGAQQG